MSRSASLKSSARGNGNEEDVLRETRKLLNALNDENTELKSQNDILCDKLRRASDAVATATGERDALEKDMKEINFNLMQQLRTKATTLKDVEVRLEEATRRERIAANDFQQSERQREELESELMIIRERLTVSDASQRKTQRTLDDVNSTSEDHRAHFKELQSEVSKLRQKLQCSQEEHEALQVAADAFKRESAKREESLRDEHRVAVDSLSRQIASLTAEANRTARAESEALFVHDEMSQLASVSFEQMTSFQSLLRPVLESVAEFDASLGGQLSRVQELAHQLTMVRQHDELVISYLLDERRNAEQELRTLRHSVEQLQGDLASSATARDGSASKVSRLEQDVCSLEAKVKQLQAEADAAAEQRNRFQLKLRDAEHRAEQEHAANEEASKALAEADAALTISGDTNARLEQELAKERASASLVARSHHDELQRLSAAHAEATAQLHQDLEALEEENDLLQQQVREHAETLARALSRLATSHHGSRHRSQSYRSQRSLSADSDIDGKPSYEKDGAAQPKSRPRRAAPTVEDPAADDSFNFSKSIDAAVAHAQAAAGRMVGH